MQHIVLCVAYKVFMYVADCKDLQVSVCSLRKNKILHDVCLKQEQFVYLFECELVIPAACLFRVCCSHRTDFIIS